MVSSTPRPYFTPGTDSVPTVQGSVWSPGQIWTGGKSRLTGIRSPDRPAGSKSLYRLSYPAHLNLFLGVKITHLVERTDLLKINNLILGGKEIVMSLYSRLEGQRERETTRTRAGVCTSHDTGNNVTYMRANRSNIFNT